MVLTVTEDTPADMLAGSMELLVQLPQGNHLHTQKVTVQRSTPMMDLLVQIATAHKLAASSYTLQAIGERGLVLPHHPNTPIGALDALQVKLLPKNGSTLQRRTRQINQPFETTFRLQVHLPRNQLYVSRVSPRMNLGEILDEVCREKNLDRNKYELRHPVNLEERLDLSLSLQDYQLQEVTLYAKQGSTLGLALSSQDIMALQRQEERRRQLAKQSVFGFIFKKSKESSLSTDSLGARSVSPARSDETRSASPPVPPTRPQRKRRPAPKPPVTGNHVEEKNTNVNNNYNNNNNSNNNNNNNDVVVDSKEKMVISHSRNSSDSSGYHEASVLSDNQDTAGRIPETLPRRNKNHGAMDLPRKLAHTSQASKSLGNLASASGMGMGSAGEGAEEGAGGNCNGGISRGISSTSLSSTGLRKKRAAPPPPVVPSNPIISASTSTHALERIIDSEESSSISNDQPQKSCDSPTIEKADSDLGIQIVCKAPKKSSESLENSKLEEIDNYPNSNSTKREETKERETKRNSSKADFKKEENKVSLEKEENLRSVDLPEEEMIRIPFDVEDAKNVPAFVEQIVEPNVESLSRVAKRDETDETDILLQRVSETLCSTLTQVIPPPPPRHLLENDDSGIVAEMEIPNIADNSQPSDPSNPPAPSKKDDTRKSCDDVSFGNSPNLTLGNSQQDTSDYVSAIGEDLSITDWEYQLPAPPSAFRDDSSPENPEEKFDKEEPKAAKDPPEIVSRTTKSESREEESTGEMSFKSELVLEKFVGPVAAPRTEKNCETSNGNSETRLGPLEIAKSVKEELEKTFANEGPAKQERNRDKGRGNQVFDSSTLPNFKITTYKRQESLDIFGEGVESKVNAAQPRNILEGKNEKIENTSKVQSIEHIPISEPKITRYETAFRRQQSPLRKDCVDKSNRNNNKSNVYNNSSSNSVQRSKSYIAMTSNEKFREGNDEMNVEKKCNEDEKKKVVTSSDKDSEISRCRFNNGMQKSISITNLNESGNMEKYSQWRESALKRQVEPTAEKQLQSLKVLKSILPQLKKNQQTENNAVHETDENSIPKNTSSEKEEPQPEKESVKLRQPAPAERQTDEKSKVKRYTYAGPPSINISSWSERPCINVQIKNDTDYKFERDTNTGAKTIVSLNGSRDVTDSAGHETKSSIPKKTGERVKAEETKENSDQKKFVSSYSTINSGSGISKVQEEEIPEWPMNFKKLTETFDKNVCLRLKPKRTTSRFSAEANFNVNCKDSGNPNVKMTTIGDQTLPRVKRYTSIVGINSQNAAELTVNGHFVAPSKQLVGNAKMNGPVVKGIQNIEAKTEPKIANSNESHQNAIPKKCSSKEEKKNFQVPKPPTMPVITGVTLKNCNQRPKSVPANFDPRDALLESIRNFGREKLRGAADRY